MGERETYRLFAQLAGTNLDRWLEAEKADALALLAQQTEPMLIYRTQGRIAVLDKMRQLLEAAPAVVQKLN